jgi:hypothetical protein
MRRCGLYPGDGNPGSMGYAGYELLTVLAERRLMLGQSVIRDSVASTKSIRLRWRKLTKEYQWVKISPRQWGIYPAAMRAIASPKRSISAMVL